MKKYIILNELINNIADKHTNIQFIPHVTLLSGFLGNEIDLRNKSKKLAKKISPFKIYFDNIDTLNEFFRCFFLKIKLNHGFDLARKKAVKVFSYLDEDFIPHLSLAYGLYDKDVVSNIKLFELKQVNQIDYFYADAIYLAKNDEINLKWKIIEKYELV